MTTENTTPEPAAPKSYLMWIGKEHYPTIADYVNEVTKAGVSKRVATPEIAANLAQPGTMVYLAHDEGERKDCPHCLREIENPERRKAQQALQNAERELDNRKRDRDAAQATFDKAEDEGKAAAEAVLHRAQKLVNNSQQKVVKLTTVAEETPSTVQTGSGGTVELKDGQVWDYRKYMYWRNQPKKWSMDNVKEAKMCQHCGGFGTLPVGRVFGVFMPSDAEYILKPEDGAKVQQEMKDKGIVTVTSEVVKAEAKRGCGYRHAGGSYVVTRTSEATPEQLLETVTKLTEAGLIKPENTRVTGSFVEFIAPVSIEGEKRFRGVKVWDPTPEAADEGEMVADAMAV